MIVFQDIKLHYWSNRFCDHPVAAAHILKWDTETWDFSSVPDQVRKLIADRLCTAEPPDSTISAEGFLFWTMRAIQSFWDVAPPITGRMTDVELGRDYLYCAFGDPAIARQNVAAAVHITNFMLTGRGRKAFSVNVELRAVTKRLDKRALRLTTRAVLRTVTGRGIMWRRAPILGGYVFLGQGANKRLFHGPVTDAAGFLGTMLARDKHQSLELLSNIGLPVGSIATSLSAAMTNAISLHRRAPTGRNDAPADDGALTKR